MMVSLFRSPNVNKTYNRSREFFIHWGSQWLEKLKRGFREHHAKQQEMEPQDRIARSSSRATWIVALFSIVTALVGLKTYYTLDGQLKVMQGQLKNDENNQRLNQEQTRAFVTLVNLREGTGIDRAEGEPAQLFLPEFKNIGGTRANVINVWVCIHYFPKEIPQSFDVATPCHEIGPIVKTNSVVAPNGLVPMGAIALATQYVQDALAGKGMILLWGHGEYTTIYNSKKIIPINLCLIMIPLKSPPGVPQSNSPSYFPQVFRPDCNYSN